MPRRTTLAAEADLIVCIGSSLEVYPVAGLPGGDARRRRAASRCDRGPDALRRRGRRQAGRRRGGRSWRPCSAALSRAGPSRSRARQVREAGFRAPYLAPVDPGSPASGRLALDAGPLGCRPHRGAGLSKTKRVRSWPGCSSSRIGGSYRPGAEIRSPTPFDRAVDDRAGKDPATAGGGSLGRRARRRLSAVSIRLARPRPGRRRVRRQVAAKRGVGGVAHRRRARAGRGRCPGSSASSASSATRACSAASRVRPASRSARARSTSSSQASTRSRAAEDRGEALLRRLHRALGAGGGLRAEAPRRRRSGPRPPARPLPKPIRTTKRLVRVRLGHVGVRARPRAARAGRPRAGGRRRSAPRPRRRRPPAAARASSPASARESNGRGADQRGARGGHRLGVGLLDHAPRRAPGSRRRCGAPSVRSTRIAFALFARPSRTR